MSSAEDIVFLKEFFELAKIATVFAFVLAIIWLNRHFKYRRQETKLLSDDEQRTLDDLARIAEKLDARVVTLEKILDAEDPKWRDRDRAA